MTQNVKYSKEKLIDLNLQMVEDAIHEFTDEWPEMADYQKAALAVEWLGVIGRFKRDLTPYKDEMSQTQLRRYNLIYQWLIENKSKLESEELITLDT